MIPPKMLTKADETYTKEKKNNVSFVGDQSSHLHVTKRASGSLTLGSAVMISKAALTASGVAGREKEETLSTSHTLFPS
jgi:hypothetical protein